MEGTSMKPDNITREELWARQNLSATGIDYAVWERDKAMLLQMAKINRTCTFVVDVYKCRYAFASSNFSDLLGYDSHKIATLEKQGDYLESRIHPDDRQQLEAFQIRLGEFIYSLPAAERNNYCNIYSFRVRNIRQQYVRVIRPQPQERRDVLPFPPAPSATDSHSAGNGDITSYPGRTAK